MSVKNSRPGRHADGDGLYLLVKPTGARSWLLRVQHKGRRRDIGLGSVDTVTRRPGDALIDIPILQRKVLTLAEAREKAALLRGAAKAGLDPVAERDKKRLLIPTFREAAKTAHKVFKEGLTAKDGDAFLSSLENHAFKTLGSKRVDTITAADIISTLAPIWTSKATIARKVRQRIDRVLNYAHSMGWRPTEAPHKSVGAGLPRQPKGSNFAAMPYADVPSLVRKLSLEAPSKGRRALLLLIFTAARPGEVRNGRWKQLDLANRDWNRPAEIMKERVAHTVTLNDPAVALLEQIRIEDDPEPGALFFGNRDGNPISDMTMNKVLRDADLPFDAHGFRSSFRDWAAEQMPEIPDPVAEAALSHSVADDVVRAYKRTSFVALRRTLLRAWGEFLTGVPAPADPTA